MRTSITARWSSVPSKSFCFLCSRGVAGSFSVYVVWRCWCDFVRIHGKMSYHPQKRLVKTGAKSTSKCLHVQGAYKAIWGMVARSQCCSMLLQASLQSVRAGRCVVSWWRKKIFKKISFLAPPPSYFGKCNLALCIVKWKHYILLRRPIGFIVTVRVVL